LKKSRIQSSQSVKQVGTGTFAAVDENSIYLRLDANYEFSPLR